MNIAEIEKLLIDFIKVKTDREVFADTPLFDENILDSMGFVELVAYTEETFSVEFDANELDRVFDCVEDISRAIAEKLD